MPTATKKNKSTQPTSAQERSAAAIDPLLPCPALAEVEFGIDPDILKMRLGMALSGCLIIAEACGEILVSESALQYFERALTLLKMPIRKIANMDDLHSAFTLVSADLEMSVGAGMFPSLTWTSAAAGAKPECANLVNPPHPPAMWTLHIHLEDSSPPIWRRLRVRNTITLRQVHEAIQAAFGWTDNHLHLFLIQGEVFGCDPEDDYDESAITLNQLKVRKGSKFEYVYDYGDDWRHIIKIEKIDKTDKLTDSELLGAELACPPEDSGGMWGYYEKLAVLKDPKHPDHAATVEWMGEDWSTEYKPKVGTLR